MNTIKNTIFMMLAIFLLGVNGTALWAQPLSVTTCTDQTIPFGASGYDHALISTTVAGGTGPYTYLWSTGDTTESIVVSPTDTTTYSVTVTDALLATASDNHTVNVVDITGTCDPGKIIMCHDFGTPDAHEHCIKEGDIEKKLKKSDRSLGPCDMSFDLTGGDCGLPPKYGCECKDGMVAFTVYYNGPSGATISAYAGSGHTDLIVTFTGVNNGDYLTIDGSALPDGELENTTYIQVNSDPDLSVHTSCSKDIPGTVLGDLTVISTLDGQGYICEGGNGCGCAPTCGCDCDGGVVVLDLIYHGPAGADVVIADGADTFGVYTGVNPGDTLYADASLAGEDKLGTNIDLFINGGFDIDIHTSCSQPLMGLTFGNFEVIGFIDKEGNVCRDMTVSLSAQTPDCPGDLTAVVYSNIDGGKPPFIYAWSNGASTKNLVNVAAGTYSLTVTDFNLCSRTASITVTQPDSFDVTLDTTSADCHGSSTGGINLTVTGGTSPYTYNWSNGATTEDLTSLSVGWYTVTITDDFGCEVIDSAEIIEPDSFYFTGAVVTDVKCYGESNGEIDVSVTGGTLPYDYVWGHGPTVEDVAGLSQGTYYLTVIDNKNCIISDSFAVGQPDTLEITASAVDSVSCFSGSDGSIDITVAGGNPPLSFAWDSGQSTEDISGLVAGPYSVTITDAKGCIATGTFNVEEPLQLVISDDSLDHVDCYGNATGSIDITPAGGTLPYSYSWSNAATTQDLTGLTAGTFGVTVTDDNGCTVTGSYTLTEPDSLRIINADVEDVNCNGGSDGSIDITVAGGTVPMTFSWSNGASTQDIAGLPAGGYDVTVSDDEGCMVTGSYTVSEPPTLQITGAVVTDAACKGTATGSIDVSQSGGTAPFSYSWNTGAISQDLTLIPQGTYSITVTDANGCTDSDSWTVDEPDSLVISSGLVTDVDCQGNSTGEIDISIAGGTTPYAFVWSNGATTEDISSLTAGTYSVTVTDDRACTTTGSYTVNEPDLLEIQSMDVTDATCNGSSNGAIDLTVLGGVTPYAFSWDNGAITEDLSGLVAGSYGVTVTDANGCTVSDFARVDEPDTIASNLTAVLYAGGFNVSCNGASDGSITSSPSGGTPPYTFAWDNGSTTAIIDGLPAGTYSVTITDDNGCTGMGAINLSEPPALQAILFPTVPKVCPGASTGKIDMNVVGGAPPYVINWSNGATTEDIEGLSAGIYSVSVDDQNGCYARESSEITEFPEIDIAISTIVQPSCNGFTDGQIFTTVSGGEGTLSFQWYLNGTPFSTAANPENIEAGNYEFVVTDSEGCQAEESFSVGQPAPIDLNTEFSSPRCHSYRDGYVDLNVSGGRAPYNYLWSDGSTDDRVIGLGPGTISVTVTDDLNCSVEDSWEMIDPDPIYADAGEIENIIHCGTQEFQLNANAPLSGQRGFWNYVVGNASILIVDPTEPNTMIKPLSFEGQATLEWTITNENECVAKDSLVIDFKTYVCTDIWAPNGITPNDDGYNEVFVVENQSECPIPEANELLIFNRWGNIVYQTTHYQSDWKGTNLNGEPLPEGTYFWIFRTLDNVECEQTGYVDLRR